MIVDLIQFLNEKGFGSRYIAPSCIGLGAFILGLISMTQYKGVKETRNTVFLEKKFMIGQLWTCFFLGFASVWGLCGAKGTWGDAKHWVIIDSTMVIINMVLFYVNLYTLRTKLSNMDAAKKAGMTEAEHYDKVIVPSLKLQKNS